MSVKATAIVRKFTGGNVSYIAENSLVAEGGELMFYDNTAGLDHAAAGEQIDGVCLSDKTFPTSNFGTDNERCLVVPVSDIVTVTLPISGGTITIADEGKYFDLTTDAVDGTTESASTGQVRLLEFVSATEGIFEIVNA